MIHTKNLLIEALDVLKDAAKTKKTILIVGTKKQVKEKVKEVALATESFYINERWLGGILTNFSQIKKTTAKLTDLKKDFESGEFKNRTKKERLLIDREIQKLEKFFGGLVGMSQIPEVIVIIDIKREATAVKEARSKEITTIAVVDSNCDPFTVDYPIPMNDDASRALEYVLDLFKDAIFEGKGIKETITKKPEDIKVKEQENKKPLKAEKKVVKKEIEKKAKKKSDKK